MSRYTIRASSSMGAVGFQQQFTVEEALRKAIELRDAGFQRITLVNVESGVEITDLEQFMRDQSDDA